MRGLVPKAVLTPSGDIKVKVSPNFSPNDLAIPDPMAIPFSKLSIDPYYNSGDIINGSFFISINVSPKTSTP